jgi:isopropylmalate/homocitrate/citramalate synthase
MALKLAARTVESTANVLTGAFETPLTHEIELYDNTLREGEQPPGVVFTSDEKFEIAQALDDFGVHWANVGFPATSPEEKQAVQRITKAGFKMKTAALCRLLPADIDNTVDSGVHLVSLFLGGSDVHLRDKYRFTEAEALGKIESALRRVKDLGARAAFTVEDASRTPLPRLLRMLQVAQDAGADYLKLADTVGVFTPTTCYRVTSILRSLLTRPIGIHFHDDLGLALANSLAALEAGAQLVDVTVNGVGERSGNTCLEELAIVLKLKYGRDLGLKLDRLYPLSQLVHRASDTQASAHKSIVGKWCFTHESGIHVAGILTNPETYQPFPPELIGRHHEIIFGKHSGAQGVQYLAEREKLPISESGRKTILEKIKTKAQHKQGLVSEEQILDWIRGESGGGGR